MANPNAALYEEILESFAAKPTLFSATDNLDNMERALFILNADPTVTLLRYHSYSAMPTFVYELEDQQTWILIDRLPHGRTKIVVRSAASLDAVSDAIAMASGLGRDDHDWGETNSSVETYDDNPFCDEEF
jgi:hypothetical protein